MHETIRYVAIGDSFSEGIGDAGPAPLPGWTGRLASGMAAAPDTGVSYANLAVRGRLLAGVIDGQLEAALALDPAPTLITFCAGGNDMLRPGYDVPALLALVEAAADRVAITGARLALLSPADPSARLPLGSLINRRGNAWAEALGTLARRRGLPFVDVSRDPHLRRAEFWSDDRLHMNATGHQRVAELALHAVTDAPAPVEPTDDGRSRARLGEELRYYREHVLPWVRRRVTRRSSGDGRSATFPTWTPVGQPAGPQSGGRRDQPAT
ncbi:SGNH/GDSL hydrolase family protein [Curtobacterium oceanosedimentum]|uniref:SGNH/GDSL hydrolase family protein n=1 Tax=Curtobacterium oceanosedimentum TaxID=465820 RepID=UPI001CE0D32B|nr:SGNH/GDSL hydrolase family protein [Curtobacterium oceanosedimentum]MCA5922109.1 SGNH/GDSL hydrolase family protein [Curtobacterium oceanosedimentum]